LGFDGKNDSYNFYSAYQKSIRGSDPDASIYYLGLLLESDDLKMVCRRLSIIAFEDISLADPSVWSATMAAVQCAEQVGMPEARIPLANATILLALSPKSNSAYSAMDEALGDIRSGRVYGIPAHLADAHYAGATKLGRGVGYQYPHDYQTGIFGGWVQQEYLPKELNGKQYYRGIPAGKEKTYIEKNNVIKNLKR
jgi:putative ATPase